MQIATSAIVKLLFTVRVLPDTQTVMAVRVGTNFACLYFFFCMAGYIRTALQLSI
jgi:hypothetical protein